MNASTSVVGTRPSVKRTTAVLVVLFVALLGPLAGRAFAEPNRRVDLRVLVLTAGDPGSAAIATQLGREGVPYTAVDLTAAHAINQAFLENAATGEAYYQAVVVPSRAAAQLSAAELSTLAVYEAKYGVRQVDAYEYSAYGVAPTFSGVLDGSPATVTNDGLAGPFSYLKGPLTIDNFDPVATEVYGYITPPPSGLPVGQTYTPLVNATAGGQTGSVVGVWAHDGREELVVTAAFNENMQTFQELAPGIVSWMTRGIHLGYQRNYFPVHIDDTFLADSRWSITGHCTPGDDCANSSITTTDIRMTPADVTRLTTWQTVNNYRLHLVFNAGGIATSDPLSAALLVPATASQFNWINHTLTHVYLGCIQVWSTTVPGVWHCQTANADGTGPNTADPLPPQAENLPAKASDGLMWLAPTQTASQVLNVGSNPDFTTSDITNQIALNKAWGVANLPAGTFNPTELVTGEHSGLRTTTDTTLHHDTIDNPFLGAVLDAQGITFTGSDASRETGQRLVANGTTLTVPRHPTNIYYNVGTYQDEVAEYNWIYTSAANGGSDICSTNSASTCITPLPATDNAAAQTSFTSYVVPLETRIALGHVLTNDPNPVYAHQSNLAEDGVLYPVMTSVLADYRAVFAANAPIVNPTETESGLTLSRFSTWNTNKC